MKQRLFYSMLAWLLCLCNAAADEIIIDNVTVSPGETIDLPVGFSFTSTSDKVGFTFSLELPSGLTLVLDEDDELVYEKDNSISKLNIICEGYSIGGQPSSSKATIKGTEGTLLTLHLSADKSIKAGNHVVNVTKCTFQQTIDGTVTDINLPDFTFTVTVEGSDEAIVVLDETSTTAPAASENVTANVKRSYEANQWSTICLPFAMTDAQLKEAFGDSYQLADFSGCTATKDGDAVTGIKVNFTAVTSGLAANHPYIIKASKAISEFSADNVAISPSTELGISKSGGQIKGNYVNGTAISANGLFLNGGKFYYSTGATKMKAFRAYFDLNDVLTDKSAAKARVVINVAGGSATSIEASELRPAITGKIYSLGGQEMGDQLESLPKGVYIKDGKKVVKK